VGLDGLMPAQRLFVDGKRTLPPVGTSAYLAAYLRLQSGSVWPAVVMHAAWNSIVQGPFDRATVGTPLAVGESGWMTASVSVIRCCRTQAKAQRKPLKIQWRLV